MSWSGFTNSMGPAPGGTLGGPGPDARGQGGYTSPNHRQTDSRVLWAYAKNTSLKQSRMVVTDQMRRSLDMARGKQWTGNRAPWKAASRINYCAWAPEQWAALLSDNKPRSAFSAIRGEDQWKADIATAAWLEWYDEEDIQAKIQDAIKLAAIVKKAYIRLTYDPIGGKHGQGTQRATVVPGWQIYVNDEATSVEDASVLMYEYPESEGEVLFQYPHLRGKLSSAERRVLQESSSDQLAPRQHYSADATQWGGTGSVDYHQGAYEGPTASESSQRGAIVVREFWMRPRGPEAFTTVRKPAFNALGKPATKHRLIEFSDGHVEPLHLVLLAGNLIYEVPLSVVPLLQQAASLGGPAVLKVSESLEAVMEDCKVPLYPDGRRLVIIGTEVAADQVNPFAHGCFPFIEFCLERDGARFWPLSVVDKIIDLQEYLNRLYSLLLDAAILTSNPVWVIPQQTELADEEITNAPGAIIRVDPVFLKSGASRRQGPEMPQYVQNMLQFTISQIREISGLTEIATGGGKFKGQQAAETVSMYQEAAGVRFRPAIRSVERALVKMGYQFVKNMGQFYGQPRLVRLEKAAGIERTISFIGTRLTGDLRLRVKAGSMLPSSPTARMTQMFNTLGLPFPTFDMPEFYAALEEFGLVQNGDQMIERLQKLAQQLGIPGEQWKWPMTWMKLMAPPPKKGGGKKSNSGRSVRQRPPGT